MACSNIDLASVGHIALGKLQQIYRVLLRFSLSGEAQIGPEKAFSFDFVTLLLILRSPLSTFAGLGRRHPFLGLRC